MFKSWRIVGLLAVLLPLGILPACNTNTVGPGSSGKPFVAFITNNASEFWTIAQKGTEAAALEFDVRVEFRSPSPDTSEQQRKIIEDLKTLGVKAIAISPNDSANQVSYFKRLNQELPVLAVDNDIPDPAARRCYIGTDNVTAGRGVGKLVRQALPDGGKFMIFVGKLDSQNAQERRLGVVTELAGGTDQAAGGIEKMNKNEYPIAFGKWELLDTRTDDGKQDVCRAKAEDAVNKYPDLRCIIGLWAYNPPAMLGALKSQGKLGKVSLIGFDEMDETLLGIRDGSIVGTVVQDPYNFGYEAVKVMAGIVKGDAKALDRPDMNAQKQIYVRHRIVNQDGQPGSQYKDEKVEAVDPFTLKLHQLTGKK